MGSVFPDIVACRGSTDRLAVLSNHGALNFSVSDAVGAANIACDISATAMAVSDADFDGNDDIFVSSGYGTNFLTYLPNGSFVSAAPSLPPLLALSFPTAIFTDLDGDSFVDLVWTGQFGSKYSMLLFHYVGGNFSAVPNSISGVIDGSISVAEFTGDANVDIVVSGRLVNGSRRATLYAQNGSLSFVLHSNIIFSPTTAYSAAAVPLRSQTSALDLVLSANTHELQYASPMVVLLNNGNGSFSNATAPWLPTAFRGIVSRGPDIGASPSFLAFGETTAVGSLGSTVLGYYDGGSLVSYVNSLFSVEEQTMSLYGGEVVTMDFNYDGCTDAFMSGYESINYATAVAAPLLAGDCFGGFRATALSLPGIFGGDAVARDFDLDGLVEYFAIGADSNFIRSVYFYRFQLGGVIEATQSSLPNILGLYNNTVFTRSSILNI